MADQDIEKTADNAVAPRFIVIERERGYVKFSRGPLGNLRVSFDKHDGEHIEGHLLNSGEIAQLLAVINPQ